MSTVPDAVGKAASGVSRSPSSPTSGRPRFHRTTPAGSPFGTAPGSPLATSTVSSSSHTTPKSGSRSSPLTAVLRNAVPFRPGTRDDLELAAAQVQDGHARAVG